jgi:DNA-binding response OmpR family regulator
MESSKKKILVVENDMDMLFLLQKALDECGYEVEICKDGSSIVEQKTDQWPDLFILDKQLPTIDGIAISKYLRINKTTRHIPIIMISAFPLKRKANEIGVNEFIPKPFDLHRFLVTVSECINRQHQESFH